jgi:hypothetical protein
LVVVRGGGEIRIDIGLGVPGNGSALIELLSEFEKFLLALLFLLLGK